MMHLKTCAAKKFGRKSRHFLLRKCFQRKVSGKTSACKYLQHKTSAKKCVRKCLPQKVSAENRDIFDLQMFAARNSGRKSRNFWFANVCSASFRPKKIVRKYLQQKFSAKHFRKHSSLLATQQFDRQIPF